MLGDFGREEGGCFVKSPYFAPVIRVDLGDLLPLFDLDLRTEHLGTLFRSVKSTTVVLYRVLTLLTKINTYVICIVFLGYLELT